VTFGVKAGPTSTVRLMEFGTTGDQAGQLLADDSYSFKGFAFLHDFAITPNWAVFLQNAVAFNPLGFVLGQKGAAQCLSSKPGQQGQFWLVPRASGAFAGQKPRLIKAPEGFVFHHLNAFEEASGDVVVDSIFYADFPSIGPNVDFRTIDFDSLPEGQLKRCRIDLKTASVSLELLEPRCCEFAMVNPAHQGLAARYGWHGGGRAGARQRSPAGDRKSRPAQWRAAGLERLARGFVNEPVMVPTARSLVMRRLPLLANRKIGAGCWCWSGTGPAAPATW
jgi:all-trans-8'-apo-beta-carotenal 15,15'-oxygenase